MGKFILYVLPFLSIVGILGTIALGQDNLAILSVYVLIPIIIAPVIYYKYQKAKAQNINKSDELFKFLVICCVSLLTNSVILLNMSEVRPLLYYAVIALAAVFILLQILLFEVTPRKLLAIFAQIVLINLDIIWGVTLKYYYFIGRTDTLAHAWLVENLLKLGHVTDIFGLYAAFPLWHILIDTIYSMTGADFPVYRMMFIVSGLIYALTPLALYLVVAKVIKNEKIALISSLLISFQTMFIFDGMYSIARSAVIILMTVLILLLLDNKNKNKFWLAILITFGITLYHTVSIAFILSILVLLYVLQKIFIREKAEIFLPLKYLVISIVMVAVYWVLMASDLVQSLYSNLVFTAPEGLMTQSIISGPFNELANYLQYMPLLLFILVGAGYIFRGKEFNNMVKVFALASLLIAPLIFPGPLLLINKLAENLNIDRFEEYGLLFTSMIGAVGLSMIFYKAGKLGRTCLVLFFAAFVILAVSNDFVASDNPLVKRPFFTYYLTQSEVTGIDHLADLAQSSNYVMGDYIVKRYMDNSPYVSVGQLLEATYNNTMPKNSSNDIMLVRTQELDKRPLRLYQLNQDSFRVSPAYGMDNNMQYFTKNSPIWSSLDNASLVYNSNDVSGYE